MLEPGALPVLRLFLATIVATVSLHNYLDLPPALGMMAGLGALKAYSYVFNYTHRGQEPVVDDLDHVFAESALEADEDLAGGANGTRRERAPVGRASESRPAAPVVVTTQTPQVVVRLRTLARPLDTFAVLEKIEWDTLLFFYGVLLAVGGLGALGYLALTSELLYGHLGSTPANVLVGLLSAVVDNVPVMFAVLQMNPTLPKGEWLLVTLTTGVGGSLLSVGSAAGVALMGQARGVYTFGTHLRWSWAVALGFLASVLVHQLLQDVLRVWG